MIKSKKIFSKRFLELLETQTKFKDTCEAEIVAIANAIVETFKNGNKILICGNGGSAADAQHLAAEFINAFSREINRKSLPAIALTTDTSILTSIANDFDFKNVFARQVQGIGNKNDLLIAITTSGSSENCIEAIRMGKSLNLKTIAFSRVGGEINQISDLSLAIPSENTQHIQECHLFSYHVIAEIVEQELFGEENS